MTRTIGRLWTAAALLALTLAAAPARACGGGSDDGNPYNDWGFALGMAALSVVTVPLDLGFSIYDGVKAGRDEVPGKGAAVTETLLMGTQTTFGLLVMADAMQHGAPDAARFMAIWSIWPAILTAHGIWALSHPVEPAERVALAPPGDRPGSSSARRSSWRDRIALVPTVVSDGHEIASGIGAIGRF